MRFPDFLRATTMAAGASATLLAVLTLAGINGTGNSSVAYVAIGWWLVAAIGGSWIGRQRSTSPQIASLLYGARTQMSLPELHPSRTLINRLWPLLVLTVAAAIPSFLFPQVPAVAAGFAVVWALLWRHQSSAVTAIEQRDGARFYVEKTRVWQPMRLVRTPGFRANVMQMARENAAETKSDRAVAGPARLLKLRLKK
jgi:hypothetical protein